MRYPLACALVCLLACGGDDSPADCPAAPSAVDAAAPGRQLAAQGEPDAEVSEGELDAGAEAPQVDAEAPRGPDAQAPSVDAGRKLTPAETARSYRPGEIILSFGADALKTCVGCHSQTGLTVQPYLDQSWPAALLMRGQGRDVSTCKGLPYITDGSPEQSYLYLALTPQSPCKQHAPVDRLTPEGLANLADWITVAPWSTADAGVP